MHTVTFLKVPDYHMHTPRCNHATGSILEYAEAACQAGISEIGFSDHSPMPNGFDKAWRMAESELDSYVSELEDAREKFNGHLTIKAALEVDYYPGAEEHIQHLRNFYDWDYFIGSVHFIDSWGFDNPDEIEKWESCDIEQAYCDYFNLVAQSAQSALFDVIGHPDLIKKFAYRVKGESKRVDDAENRMLQAVKASEAALEISSAGLRKPVAEIYPHQRIIAKAAALDIPFSYGSDAHAPSEVGHAMEDCLSLLHRFGVKEVASFSKRQRTMQSFIKA